MTPASPAYLRFWMGCEGQQSIVDMLSRRVTPGGLVLDTKQVSQTHDYLEKRKESNSTGALINWALFVLPDSELSVFQQFSQDSWILLLTLCRISMAFTYKFEKHWRVSVGVCTQRIYQNLSCCWELESQRCYWHPAQRDNVKLKTMSYVHHL